MGEIIQCVIDFFRTHNEIVNLLSNVFVGLIFFFLGRLYERKDFRKKEISEAKKEFIAVFDDVLETFDIYGRNPDKVLLKAMPKHKLAFDKFRVTIMKIKGDRAVNGLNKVWTDYYSGDQPWTKYQPQPRRENATKEAKGLAIQKIEAIIDFVNNKL